MPAPQSDLPPIVDFAQAERLVSAGAIVLDTRSMVRFLADGHLAQAARVSWRIGTSGALTDGALGDPSAAASAFAALGVQSRLPVLVVGDWDAGWGEEGRVYWDLEYLGHTDVHVLRGGMQAWTGDRTRSPLRTFSGTVSAADFIAAPRSSARVTTADLAAAVGSAGPPLLLDVRERAEFAGATPYGERRGGHIPGAVSLPWRDLLAGGAPDPQGRAVVVTCTGGVRSGMAYLMLRNANIGIVANYDVGMWGWTRTDNVVTTDP